MQPGSLLGLSHQCSNHWATFTKQLPASCHSVYNVTVHLIAPLPPYVYDLDTLLHCSLAFSVMAFSATICIYSTDRYFSIFHFHLTISPHWLSFSLHVTTLFYQSYWCIDSRSSARLGSWHCGCPGEGWGDLWPWRRRRAGGWLCADGNTVAYVLKERMTVTLWCMVIHKPLSTAGNVLNFKAVFDLYCFACLKCW